MLADSFFRVTARPFTTRLVAAVADAVAMVVAPPRVRPMPQRVVCTACRSMVATAVALRQERLPPCSQPPIDAQFIFAVLRMQRVVGVAVVETPRQKLDFQLSV